MSLFNALTRQRLEKENKSDNVSDDTESQNEESKSTKIFPKHDSVKLVRTDLQSALTVIKDLQRKIESLEKSTIQCSNCQPDMKRIKDILGINDEPKPNTTLNSHNTEPELAKIHKARHIVNIGDLIYVNQATWKFGGSHSEKIMALFGNSEAIVKIYQLKPRAVKGKTLYPVNIYFSSEVASDNAIAVLKSVCDRYGKKMPTVQFALTGFPTLQKRVRIVSSILNSAKKNDEIVAFSITNFSMARDKTIIPLYAVKAVENGPWSKHMESRTLNPEATSNGHFFQENISEIEEQNLIQTLTEKIISHIQSIDHTQVPPRSHRGNGHQNTTQQNNSPDINQQHEYDSFIKSSQHNKRDRSHSSSPILHAMKKQHQTGVYNNHPNNIPHFQGQPSQQMQIPSPPPNPLPAYTPNPNTLRQSPPHHLAAPLPHFSQQHNNIPYSTSVPTLPQHQGVAPVYAHRPVVPQPTGFTHSTIQGYPQTYLQQQNSGVHYTNNNM